MKSNKEVIKQDAWNLWEKNFYNAKRFFNTKGNIKTKAKLKAKWFSEYKKDLIKFLKD
jgi:hypothetical protein